MIRLAMLVYCAGAALLVAGIYIRVFVVTADAFDPNRAVATNMLLGATAAFLVGATVLMIRSKRRK